jgi:Transposase DDE domain
MRARCTNDVRSVSRLENEAVLDRMAERLKKRPEVLDRRREVVEHPLGSIKQWMYQGAFLMRGLANVRAEFSLTALAYNLRRALNILGVEAMTAARPLRSHQTANGAKAAEIPSCPLLAPLNAQVSEFPHGLGDLRTAGSCDRRPSCGSRRWKSQFGRSRSFKGGRVRPYACVRESWSMCS